MSHRRLFAGSSSGSSYTPDPPPAFHALRWEAGPEPETWRLILPNGREVGRVGPSDEAVIRVIGRVEWYWQGEGMQWALPEGTAEAARRACQSWAARLASGGEGEDEDKGGEG